MNIRKIAWLAFVGILLGVTWANLPAHASRPYQDQSQSQIQGQDQAASAYVTDSSSLSFSTENTTTNTVLVPNNNTESCLRVFGLAFGNSDTSTVLGIPWRSGPCDLEASADDAFAQGNLVLGWMFKCKMKANKKAFGSEADCIAQTTNVVDLLAEVDRLRSNIDTLLQERDIDRTECEESKDRILEGCLK